jgi:5-methylcytosine-specific restriction protein B
MLKQNVKDELKKWYRQMYNNGEFIPKTKLPQYYQNFREKFGPEKLQELDGEALLSTMHEGENRDSLVYWLEFKNDDEFPPFFGSISGGSAHKFGLFKKKNTGEWIAGSANNNREVSKEEAIEIARSHRNQLVKGCNLLEKIPENAEDDVYRQLQKDMEREAPDVCDSAWGHKYFSLIYPDKLDDYHAGNYQRFHLIKLLQTPPEGQGRFVCAGRFVAIVSELDIPINHLTTLLNKRNGRPYNYWRVRVNYTMPQWQNKWEEMYQGGYVAIGWKELGDLTDIEHNKSGLEKIKKLMRSTYNESGGWAREVYNFAANMEIGDVVLAFEQDTVLGIGRIDGEYQYVSEDEISPHHRTVRWMENDRWTLPVSESSTRTVRKINDIQNHLEVETHLFSKRDTEGEIAKRTVSTTNTLKVLDGVPGKMQSILNRKKQVILHGPPGTGKTYWAYHTAFELASRSWFHKDFDALNEDERKALRGDEENGGAVRVCTFHPAYGYEDFIEGYRPEKSDAGQMVFTLKRGVFRSICDDAEKQPNKNFYLVIDEINRGDIPRIFGELITLIEKDKRGLSHQLPLSREPFHVPNNIYLIGTMNTADRSIALLDTALRRRFGFIELMPDYSVLGDIVVGDSIPLAGWLEKLNERIINNIGRDARNLQIGHAYLMENGKPVSDMSSFTRILEEDIVPLLQEYCYEDYHSLASIIGDRLVDRRLQRVRYEFFEPNQRDNLIQILLEPAREITTSSQFEEYIENEEEAENGEEIE